MADWVNVYDADGNPIGVAKSADIAPFAASEPVRKADEQRFVLGIAYQVGPDPRIAKGADGGRDFFTEAELEKACWSFMLNGQQHGMFHLDGTENAAQPVENYIYRNPVPWVASDDTAVCKTLTGLAAEVERCAGPDDLVVRKGDWCLGSILDHEPWEMVKAGKANGWSPQGIARRRRVSR